MQPRCCFDIGPHYRILNIRLLAIQPRYSERGIGESMEADQIAMLVIAMTAIIVIFDGWKLRRANKDIPNLGQFSNGGMAWQSKMSQELVRNFTMIGAMIVMCVAPWFLAERSGTSTHWLVIFDLLLATHICWLLLPKRYAITKDALWVDGFSVDWNRLWWSGYSGGTSIVLQRKGWWRLAPLPLGGSEVDLAAAALRIDAIMVSEWESLSELLNEDE